MKSGELAQLLGVHQSSIVKWSKEFEEFLSEKRGAHRQYVNDDARIIATIAYMTLHEKAEREAIVARLNARDYVDLNELKLAPDNYLVATGAVQQIIDAAEISKSLEDLRNEKKYLLDELDRREMEIIRMREVSAEIQKEKERLLMEVGELRGRLETLKELNLKEKITQLEEEKERYQQEITRLREEIASQKANKRGWFS